MANLVRFKFIIGIVLFLAAKAGFSEQKSVTISINNHDYIVELADTFEERAIGLMYRQSLCQHCGMLFSYAKEKELNFWMKNTYIPLDIAFISKHGKIIAIKQLVPHDLNGVSSNKPVLYALEMNQGWFQEQQINVGDSIIIKK